MTIYVLIWSFISPNNSVYTEIPRNFSSLQDCIANKLDLERELAEGGGECIRVDIKAKK